MKKIKKLVAVATVILVLMVSSSSPVLSSAKTSDEPECWISDKWQTFSLSWFNLSMTTTYVVTCSNGKTETTVSTVYLFN